MSLGSIESRVYVLRAIGFTNFLLVLADLLNRFAQIGWPWASFVQTGAFCGDRADKSGRRKERATNGRGFCAPRSAERAGPAPLEARHQSLEMVKELPSSASPRNECITGAQHPAYSLRCLNSKNSWSPADKTARAVR